jgi:hypothetical protein
MDDIADITVGDPAVRQVVERLGAMGRVPVDPAVQARHLTAMAGVRRPASRFGRAKLVAAFAAGLVLGGTGLASAGVLGETPQNAVADAAAHVGIDLPGGTPRSTEGCGGKTYKNHGQFVRDGGDPHAPCGKPVVATTGSTVQPGSAGTGSDHAGCRPPWAGKGNQDKRTPEAMAEHRARCGDDAGDEETPVSVPSTTVPAQGRSEEAPGHTGAAPGKDGDTPGQSGDTPGQSGQTPDADTHGGDVAPGVTESTPGQSGDTPGQSGQAPAQP